MWVLAWCLSCHRLPLADEEGSPFHAMAVWMLDDLGGRRGGEVPLEIPIALCRNACGSIPSRCVADAAETHMDSLAPTCYE